MTTNMNDDNSSRRSQPPQLPPPPPPPSQPRDPRLATHPSRPSIDTIPSRLGPPSLPTPKSELSSQKRSPQLSPKTQPNPRSGPISGGHNDSGYEFVQALEEFSQSRDAENKCKAEKENLERDIANNERHLQKSRGGEAFPPTIAIFEQTKARLKEDLARVEKSLGQHASNHLQTQERLRNFWTERKRTPEGGNERRMAELESQVNELKNSIPKDLPKQHNSPNFERFEQKLAKLESELRELKHPVVSKEPSPPTDEDSLNSRLKKAENSVTKQSHRNMEQTRDLEAISLRMKELEKKFESISNVGSRLHELEKRPTDSTQLALPTQTPDTPSPAQIQHTDTQLKFLQNRLQGLEGRFDLLANASKMTHDIHMQELEKDTKRIGRLETDYHQFAQRLDKSAKELVASQTAYANSITGNQSGINLKVRDDLNKLSGAVDKVSKEMVPELSKSLGKSNGLLQSVIQGTRSLESRFQQLTTEPLVKHMMHAMQEMYPSVGTLSEQVQVFKGHAEKEIAEVKEKLEKLATLPSGEGQSEVLEKLRAQLEKHQEESTGKIDAFTSGLKKDLRSQLDEILGLQNDFATQSNAVADLGEKIASRENEWPPDDCRKLSTSVSDLREEIKSCVEPEEIKVLTSKVDNLTANATTKSQTEQLETRLKAVEELASPETAEWIKEKFAELDRIQHESIPRIFNRIRTYEDCSRSVQSPAEDDQKLDKSASDNPSRSGNQQPPRGPAQGQLAKAMLKKKRSRHSLASDDDRSLPGTPSASNSSPLHPSSSSDVSSSKKNKRTKKRKDQDATQR